MKTFFWPFKKREIEGKIKEVFTRFPIGVILSILVTLLFFSLIAVDFSSLQDKIIGKVIISVIVTFFLSIGVTLLLESLQKTKGITLLGQGCSLLFGGLFYYFLSADISNFENIVFFTLTLSGVISLLFIAPYIKHIQKKIYTEESYYVYFYKIAALFFISSIVGGSLALLGNIAIATVQTLFDIEYSSAGDLYGYWTSFALAFLTPLFALTQLPRKDDFFEKYFNENVFFNFLIRYIAIPFIYVYFFILYAYTLKVLLNFSNWPKGEVSWMVIGFSSFGYIIYIFSYIFECGKKKLGHKLITLFRKFFPYVVFPQIAMLFYAIYLRIGQYDLTINRYFVVIFGLWLLIVSGYLIISRKKSLLFIPTIFTLLSLIISIGPWSVYHLPLSRQTTRLEKNMIEAGILEEEGKITPLKNYNDISPELSNEIYSGINYICDFDECASVKQIFPTISQKIIDQDFKNFTNHTDNYSWRDRVKDDDEEYHKMSRWEFIRELTKILKVQFTYDYKTTEQDSYYIYTSDSVFPIDTSGYDFLLQIGSYQKHTSAFGAYVKVKESTLEIRDGEEIDSIDISDIINTVRNKYSSSPGGNIEGKDLIFTVENEIYKGKLFIDNASIPVSKEMSGTNLYNNFYINGYLLVRKK